MAPLPRPEPLGGDAREGRARQAQDRGVRLVCQAANVAVPALAQGDLEPGLAPFDPQAPHLGRLRRAVVDDDAAAERLEPLITQLSGHLGHVHARHAGARVHQGRRELPVAGEQQHPAGLEIQAADGHHPRPRAAHQIRDRLPALRVAQRAHHPARLVQHQVHERLGDEPGAVDLDPLPARIGARAELGDDLAVDLDAASADELLGFAARRHSGARQDLLQAFFGHRLGCSSRVRPARSQSAATFSACGR